MMRSSLLEGRVLRKVTGSEGYFFFLARSNTICYEVEGCSKSLEFAKQQKFQGFPSLAE